ncbi:hypothetical protein QBD00_004129 [Ochrobactrum sp. AN78]|jgi:hypothetical protein|nr:hypothetical protein [Ochrobactrum sp. AN78]
MQILHNPAARNRPGTFSVGKSLSCGIKDGPRPARRSPQSRLRVDTILAASVR